MRRAMKRLATIVGFTILCMYLNTWAAEEPGSFSGTWILDSKKSDAFPRPIMDMGSPVGDVSRGGGFGGGMGGGMPPGGGMGGPGGGMGGPGGGMPGGAGGGRGPQAPQQPVPVVIQQTESEMHITSTMKGMDGKEIPIIENYKLDGKELVEMVPVPNSADKFKKTTKATLKKNKFQVRIATSTPQGLSETNKEYSLSKDGKTLTLEISTSMSMFRSIQKLVYNKQYQ